MAESELGFKGYMPDIHLRDYLQIILRRRWVIITVFVTLVVTVLISSLKEKPLYQAIATLMIERESPNVVSFKEVTPMGPSDYQTYRDYYETQYKLMKSRSVLAKVMDSLKLNETFSGKRNDPVERFSKILKVSPVRNSQLVEIAVEYHNPGIAAKVANEIADEYMRQNLERSINATHDAAMWLSKKIAEQRQKVMESELVLQDYRLKHNINVLPQMSGEEATENVKAEYARLQALFDNYSQRYTDGHPKMIELKAQINSLKNKIQGLEDVDMGNKTMEYMVLEREVQTNKQMYDILLTRLKETSLSSTLTGNNISIVDRAEVPQKPIKPNLKLNMTLAMVFGLIMGTGLGFFVEYLDTTIKSPDDIKEILKSHLLGVIPKIEGNEELKKDKIMNLDPSSPVSEAYRVIRTDILKNVSTEEPLKTILVTSAESQEGKTMMVSNLGIALSGQGYKVLLVDCDLRRPQLHKIFNLDKETGLSEYLLDGKDTDSIIRDTEIQNLKVVTSGKTLQNPAEALSSNKIDKFITDLRARFDFIIIDSPPVTNITDSIILADKVDASVQVVRSGKTFIPLALRTKEALEKANAKPLGVILNDLDVFSGDYYYYRYYHYYAQDNKKTSSRIGASWESKAKVNELCGKLSETWGSLKTDSRRLTSLVMDKFTRRQNSSSARKGDRGIG